MSKTDPMHRQGRDTTSDRLCIFVNRCVLDLTDYLDLKDLFLDLRTLVPLNLTVIAFLC